MNLNKAIIIMGCGMSKIDKKAELSTSARSYGQIKQRPKVYTLSDLKNVKVRGLFPVNEVGASQEISLSFSREFKARLINKQQRAELTSSCGKIEE